MKISELIKKLQEIQEEANKVIDWEQRRYEIAMHILPQTLGLGNPEMLAINAVNHADALIKELKKGGKK